MLALRLPIGTAAPLAVLVSITVAGVVVAQDWREIHFRSAGWLIFSTLFGIPLGLLLLTSSYQKAVKIALALLILGYSLYSLLDRKPPVLHRDSRRWLLVCGFCAGILGGAYGMNGPPLVMYGAMRRWSAQHFRATLQAYFLPACIIGICGYWLTGLWTSTVTHYYLASLPVTFAAIFLGRMLNRYLQGGHFLKYVYLGLTVIAITLLAQSVTGQLAW